MKTTTIQIASILAIAMISTAAQAHGEHITTGGLSTNLVTEVLYDNPAHNRGVYSYPNPIESKLIAEEDMFYIDKAHGQAIYSYPRNTQ